MSPNVSGALGGLLRSPSTSSKRRLLPESASASQQKDEKPDDKAAGGAGTAAASGAGEMTLLKQTSSSSLSSSRSRGTATTAGLSSSGSAPSSAIGSPARRRVALATPAELAVPPIAWPTVGVFLLGSALYILPPLLTWHAPSWKTLPIQAYAVFLLFTPLHDAVHRAISTRPHRWLNELIGWCCAVVFMAPFPGFRHIHLQHHKHTNVVGKDPDMWSSGGPWHASVPTVLLPFFWATQQVYYYLWYLDKMPMRPLREAMSVGLFVAALTVAVVWFLVQGLGRHFLVFALAPYMVAGTVLAYSFDYAPHRPHEVNRYESIYACTSVLGGVLDPHEDADLWLALLGQNHHNIHHLYPQIPFYRYQAVWLKHEKELRALGTPIANWIGPLKMK